ncbi:MAG: hypothetical protein KKB20_05035 [Proteobacteria bacterium]|nr:hypothetical protein [Pseudomonadota bacterium]
MDAPDKAMHFSILVKEMEYAWLAHCLELDIVATAATVEDVEKDMLDLICAQVAYAFNNDNLENLYHPAPADAWKEFFQCREQVERRVPLESHFHGEAVPSWIIANSCHAQSICRVE